MKDKWNGLVFICAMIYLLLGFIVSGAVLSAVMTGLSPRPMVETKSVAYVIPWPWSLQIDRTIGVYMVLDMDEALTWK